MVYIKIIFRNLSHEGSSDEQEEQREKNILGPHGTSKNVRGALGRENRVQTILPPDNTVADVLSIEQCCRSMFLDFGGFHWLREPICLGSSRIMYPVKAETMEPAIVISRVPA